MSDAALRKRLDAALALLTLNLLLLLGVSLQVAFRWTVGLAVVGLLIGFALVRDD